MTFNPDADLSRNTTRRRGRTAAIAGGTGIGVLGLLALIAGPLLGIDLSGLVGGAPGGGSEPAGGSAIENCDTGADANANAECRLAGAQLALDAFWGDNVEGYRAPQNIVVDGATSTQCGTASNAVGPFYCPPEETVYIDPTFFQLMQEQFGASAGNLAQLYIIGHEWGHHIQNITGTMDQYPNNGTGPGSNGVRMELQADCYAGGWLGRMTEQTDADGDPYLEKPTETQIEDALNAAAAVGDDHIQEQSGQVNPETWTHGSSEQRQRWFAEGYQNGLDACGQVFTLPADQLDP
ncbi:MULTISPECIES: KPN_02809 family neutral zinc metallopeptidase [unclassified Microbacterium]|uniref:KPN_02809 family neutral zinc metallopeptidase n=1 Tax=unclassified Microbacterium TaxID=2609290 RepID=UPI0024690289|nr:MULTISPECIES: neutral zinc metallopeptidase [unclassified Microbacterium]MDH5131918.1 neutral zinc metallopeptidase [Microbacterium sp. RD10]MDH5135819.1 neutral zinc metallopeptidase [Microbacterium sp. RD11]MDH5146753.1 neutral zinc metallopeptidase [Microbacterium sp. RD12]MDH5154106.1 neutral zinc metallopeptidase [Microbacterium sp. RD06]MDH5165814.1 neutral zinc metallopeptidase [Microbacterium sp. RD02]